MKQKVNKNFKYLYLSEKNQEYKSNDLINGKRGVVLEGSSRSGKTISSIDFIIYLCSKHDNLIINVVKETYNEFKTTLYNDFSNRLNAFGLDNPFDNAKEVSSFKIFNSKINFLGADKPSKFHGAQCDYLYINEALPISKLIFDQAEMRCKKFWWLDYNPSVTDHWIFNDVIPREDVGYLHSTFNDNPFLSVQERNKILSYKNTDSFMWNVYGLGKRGAMKGLIYENVDYIDKFPNLAFTYGLDFGFVNDPSAMVKYAQEGNNIYLELLLYKSTATPKILADFFTVIGIQNEVVTCDSSDKYTGENQGTIEMVKGLRELGFTARKVSKKKGLMFRISAMKQFKIHIVKNHLYHFAKKEAENYKFKEIHGIPINQPIDKFNHFWDASGYGFIAHNQNLF